MNRWVIRACAPVLGALLAACGGGGGDGGSSAVAARATVTISANNVTLSSAPSNASPSRSLDVAVANMPASGLYTDQTFSTRGVETVQLNVTSASTAQLAVTFKPAAELAGGTYEDTIQLSVCQDDACRQHAHGSPMTVTTRYTVSGGTVNAAAVDRSAISVIASANSHVFSPESMLVSMSGPAPVVPFTVRASNDSTSLFGVSTTQVSATQTRVSLHPDNVSPAPVGVHQDTVTVRVCYDARCRRELAGSPLRVPVTYTVVNGAIPEPGTTPVNFSSRNVLPHDVVDAKFSQALNAMVMVSSWPRNSLYVYNAATGAERELVLTRAPTRVSISPDGTRAAVGHDARVTYVDLTTAGTPGAAASVLLDVAATVGDLVLDGRGHVIVFPATGNWDVSAINIATNTQSSRYGPIYAGTRGVLHPTRSTIYSANNGLSPDDIQNLDIASGEAVLLRDSPYHGEYPMCGNLWLSADGLRIYTACGRTFRTSTIASQDMLYTGALPLSSAVYGYRVASLSERAASREVALIEYELYGCDIVSGDGSGCWSHVNLYDIDTLERTATYSLAPVEVGNTFYAQRGLFVFHRTGGSKLVVSRLEGVTDRAAQYHVSVLP